MKITKALTANEIAIVLGIPERDALTAIAELGAKPVGIDGEPRFSPAVVSQIKSKRSKPTMIRGVGPGDLLNV